jgi:hypothetical protein
MEARFVYDGFGDLPDRNYASVESARKAAERAAAQFAPEDEPISYLIAAEPMPTGGERLTGNGGLRFYPVFLPTQEQLHRGAAISLAHKGFAICRR